MFEEHKSLFKLDVSLSQSTNLCLRNILPRVFEIWKFSYICLTFGNTFELLGLFEEIIGEISSLCSIFHFKVASGELQGLFQFPFYQPFLDIFEFPKLLLVH